MYSLRSVKSENGYFSASIPELVEAFPIPATSFNRAVKIHNPVINETSSGNESQDTQATHLPTNTPLIEFGINNLPHASEIKKAVEILHKFDSLGSLYENTRTPIRDRNRTEADAVDKTTHSRTLKIPFISDLTMASLAHYYQQKYSVDISIVITRDGDSFIDYIEKAAKTMQPGHQKGLVIRIGKDSPHVTPILIQRTDKKTNILVLDSVGAPAPITLIKKINPENGKNTRVIVINPIRQSDNCSCRSDAILILKDALRFKDPISLVNAESLIKEPFKLINGCADIYSTNQLPAALSKTLQRRSMIDKLTSSDNYHISIRCDSSTQSLPKTMKTHLQKYSRAINNRSGDCAEETPGNQSIVCRENEETQKVKTDNLYLLIKAYTLIVKAFSQLEDGESGIDPEKSRQLQNNYVIYHELPGKLLNSYPTLLC